ncbi:hypothetical protein Tco_0503929 [Tanacetum coccineum]
MLALGEDKQWRQIWSKLGGVRACSVLCADIKGIVFLTGLLAYNYVTARVVKHGINAYETTLNTATTKKRKLRTFRSSYLTLFKILGWTGNVGAKKQHFGGPDGGSLDPDIVQRLIHILDEHNELVRLFRTARDKCRDANVPYFKIRLYNMGGIRGYELPTWQTLGDIVFKSRPRSRTNYDVINKLRGHYSNLKLKPRDGSGRGKKVSMNVYYKYQLHPRVNDYGLIFRGGWLFQQYVVCCTPSSSRNADLLHCHTLLWVDPNNKIENAQEVDQYISTKLPDPMEDPIGYKVVSDMMIHGPCGATNLNAPCMQNGPCNEKFPKSYNNKTFFDSNGHVHYRRKDTGIHITKRELNVDNHYVVPYNHALYLAFQAHINVEYCGWSMLIKYLIKYISKLPDRNIAKITKPIGEASTSTGNQQVRINEIETSLTVALYAHMKLAGEY